MRCDLVLDVRAVRAPSEPAPPTHGYPSCSCALLNAATASTSRFGGTDGVEVQIEIAHGEGSHIAGARPGVRRAAARPELSSHDATGQIHVSPAALPRWWRCRSSSSASSPRRHGLLRFVGVAQQGSSSRKRSHAAHPVPPCITLCQPHEAERAVQSPIDNGCV
jgi:hypothetical protein